MPNCPLCSGPSTPRRTLTGSFRLLRCESCDYFWVHPEDLARPEAAPAYDDYGYNRAVESHFERMAAHYQAGLSARLKRTGLVRTNNLRFLDVGCANGEYLKTALDTGFAEVAGIEIDASARAKAARYGSVTPSAQDLAGRLFDVIQVKNVLSNIIDPLTFMKDQCSLLAPQGVLFLDVLNHHSLTADLRNGWARLNQDSGKFSPLRPPYVINGFSPKALQVLATKLGLKTAHLETSYMGGPFVPYAPPRPVMLLGRVGAAFGKGSMIIGDFRGP